MTTIYLVRHGNKEAVPFDPALTKIGLKQAEVTGEFLKATSFQAIVVSPKTRTQQTARAIALPQTIDFILDSRLTERMEWENNETFDEFINEWSKTDRDRKYQPLVGDSSIKKGEKMKQVIQEYSDKHKDGNILLVTHGGSIGDLLRLLFGEKDTPHVIDPVTGAPHIQIGECSITVIEKDGDEYTLVKINDTSHLSTPLS